MFLVYWPSYMIRYDSHRQYDKVCWFLGNKSVGLRLLVFVYLIPCATYAEEIDIQLCRVKRWASYTMWKLTSLNDYWLQTISELAMFCMWWMRYVSRYHYVQSAWRLLWRLLKNSFKSDDTMLTCWTFLCYAKVTVIIIMNRYTAWCVNAKMLAVNNLGM